jgi:hypothetical protein
MRWFWSKSRSGKAVEAGLNILDGAIGFGLISGAAVASAFGKFLLGGLLAAFALGVFARLTCRTRATGTTRKSKPTVGRNDL